MASTVVARIKAVRKDGSEITFTDYKGERKSAKYAPVATFFRGENGKLSIKFEKGFVASEECWYNYYEETQSTGDRQPRTGRNNDVENAKVPF
jgi:hypothetical protein